MTDHRRSPVVKAGRISAFDELRGFLVIGMITVHVFSHIGHIAMPEAVMLWIPTGFVFMAGLLGGAVLTSRKKNHHLIMRGLKLIAIVIMHNIFMKGSKPIVALVTKGDVSDVMLEILLPISIVIMVLPLTKQGAMIVGALSIIGILALDYSRYSPYIVKFVLIGIVGIWAGRKTRSSWHIHNTLPLWSSVIALIITALMRYMSLPLSLSLSLWYALMPITLAITRCVPPVSRWLELLGQHSLLLYIVHVIFITMVRQFEPPLWPTYIATIVLCTLVAYFLGRNESSTWIGRIYRATFR